MMNNSNDLYELEASFRALLLLPIVLEIPLLLEVINFYFA